jgi:hypothetical protein
MGRPGEPRKQITIPFRFSMEKRHRFQTLYWGGSPRTFVRLDRHCRAIRHLSERKLRSNRILRGLIVFRDAGLKPMVEQRHLASGLGNTAV